jgi:uncharacterized protein with GYD domain
MALRKNKAFALLSVIAAATVFGVLVFSAAASEDVTIKEEETAPVFCGFRNRWLDTLTDEQLATLKEIIDENRAEVKDQLEEWGVKISELTDEQREILKTMIDENRAEVKEQLEAWGVEIPMWQGPMDWRDSLTDEQLEELQTMRQNYQDAVNAKLEEWGIEIPEFQGSRPGGMIHGPPLGGMGFRGRGIRGFGILKP